MTSVALGCNVFAPRGRRANPFVAHGSLLLDLRSTTVDLVSGNVSAWPDQVSPADDFSQGTALARPAWVTGATPNGKPAVRGSSTKYLLGPSNANLKPSAGFTVFVVAKRSSALAYQCLINGSNVTTWLSDWGIACDAAGTTLIFWAGSYAVNVSWACDTNWHLFEMVFSGASIEVFVDGVSVGSRATTMASPTTAPIALLGGLLTAPSTYGYPWQGDLADVKIYSGALGSTPRSAVRSLLTSGAYGYLS